MMCANMLQSSFACAGGLDPNNDQIPSSPPDIELISKVEKMVGYWGFGDRVNWLIAL